MKISWYKKLFNTRIKEGSKKMSNDSVNETCECWACKLYKRSVKTKTVCKYCGRYYCDVHKAYYLCPENVCCSCTCVALYEEEQNESS
jgi:hypothetical protein